VAFPIFSSLLAVIKMYQGIITVFKEKVNRPVGFLGLTRRGGQGAAGHFLNKKTVPL